MSLFGPPDIAKLKAKRDVKGLIKALGYQKDWQVRHDAATACGEIGDPQAVEPLIVVLEDQNQSVKGTAAEALGKLGDPRAVEPLVTVLVRADEWARRDAAGALGELGELGGARSVASLVAALRDPSKFVRREAADALVKIGNPAVEPLIAALNDRDKDARGTAVEALGKIGDRRAIDPLIVVLKDRDWTVCKTAVQALDELAWEPDQGVAGAIYWASKGETAKCVEIGGPAVKPLVAAMKDDKHAICWAAANALVEIADPRCIEPLSDILKRREGSQACMAAIWVVGKLGDSRVVGTLNGLLNDSYDDLRIAAAKVLGQIRDPGATEPLIAALNDKKVLMRTAVANALAEIGDPRAVEPLIAALTDIDGDVRQAVAKSLVAIYQSGRLSAEQKAKLLAQRGVITQKHHDHLPLCINEENGHEDQGIGVAFPI